MFRQTYKSAIKNLFRSGLFWFAVFILIAIAVYEAMNGYKGISVSHPVTGATRMVMDTSPEFTMSYIVYIQRIANSVSADVMFYAMPLVTILTTVLVLNRDYGDNFYEIEKCVGIKASTYLLGRITALVTVDFTLTIIASFTAFHTYYFTRGGVSFMGIQYYIIDSSIRLIRYIVFIAFPIVLFYIGVTYLLGCVFRSGLYSSIISIGYAVFVTVQRTVLRFAVPDVYADYLAPRPQMLGDYLYWYDTYSFNPNLSLKDAALAFLFQPAVFLLTLIGSYILIRKRDK